MFVRRVLQSSITNATIGTTRSHYPSFLSPRFQFSFKVWLLADAHCARRSSPWHSRGYVYLTAMSHANIHQVEWLVLKYESWLPLTPPSDQFSTVNGVQLWVHACISTTCQRWHYQTSSWVSSTIGFVNRQGSLLFGVNPKVFARITQEVSRRRLGCTL